MWIEATKKDSMIGMEWNGMERYGRMRSEETRAERQTGSKTVNICAAAPTQ